MSGTVLGTDLSLASLQSLKVLSIDHVNSIKDAWKGKGGEIKFHLELPIGGPLVYSLPIPMQLLNTILVTYTKVDYEKIKCTHNTRAFPPKS